jgi:hypothetical protein
VSNDCAMSTQLQARNPGRTEIDLGGSFLDGFCTPFLLAAQNADGGWGYRYGARSSVEVTSWVLLALRHCVKSEGLESAAESGFSWLERAQLRDGSWPAFIGQLHGCWTTGLACMALHKRRGITEGLARGLRWICRTWSAEGGFWRRLGYRLQRDHGVVRQDSSLRGWSWTPGTASWVEPTACSLIALRNTPQELHPRSAAKRRRLGEHMLYDRMCPGGGWNSGNPLVYGVAGEPRVGPTVWALVALQDYRERQENRMSLDWLERVYGDIRGPGSLALAHLCLKTYDRPSPPLEPAFRRLYCNNQFFHNILAIAWSAIALSPSADRGIVAPGG